MTTWRGGLGAGSRAGIDGAAGVPPAAREEAQYLDACVAEVQEWLGPELTAYLAGAESPAQLARWIRDPLHAPASAAGRRLRAASEVVEIFATEGQGTRARGWFREVSPSMGDRSPADLVRNAADEALLDDVREAAARHLHGVAA